MLINKTSTNALFTHSCSAITSNFTLSFQQTKYLGNSVFVFSYLFYCLVIFTHFLHGMNYQHYSQYYTPVQRLCAGIMYSACQTPVCTDGNAPFTVN